ncbi:uncharacterized protein [Amphiura filiformis]|uniref:uncharacterized protein n=1 Tax=Amphiura filiformis TaxID=82378 RepID=UPI003B21B050
MGPLQFTVYIYPIGSIIRNHSLMYHIYADDTQVYTSFNPKIPSHSQLAVDRLQNCILELSNWMKSNNLKLNMDKTEFIIFGSPHNINFVSSSLHLMVGDTVIKPATSVRNLGVKLDSPLSMNDHVSGLCQTLNFQLRNIARVRRFLDTDSCHHIIRALILSRLDYGNSLLAGTTNINLSKLQRIQNRAVRLIYGLKRRDHITPYIMDLHWLPIRERVNFKILTIIYQCVNDIAPLYLQSGIHSYTTSRHLRSSMDTTRLSIPPTIKLAGDNAFTSFGPRIWNNLPCNIREAQTLASFKKLLKTHLFPI